jgi:NAD(P)H dehydrogenase (quinone)
MSNKQNKPRILVLGSTGRTGQAVIAELERSKNSLQVVYSSRNREQVQAWRQEGKDAVHLDLDDATTMPAALKGIDRLSSDRVHHPDGPPEQNDR